MTWCLIPGPVRAQEAEGELSPTERKKVEDEARGFNQQAVSAIIPACRIAHPPYSGKN